MAAAAAPGPSWAPPEGPATRLLLVRHGATEHSPARRFSGRNDLPLSPVGRAQARALAARDLGTPSAIVSSPLRRARETAAVIAAAHRASVEVRAELAELDFGAFEGLTGAEARERYPDELAAFLGGADVAPPAGESLAALAERVERGRAAVLAAHRGGTVVVVTHVTPIKLLVRAALGAPITSLYRMHLDTASVSVIDYPAAGAASLRLFNDTGHLQPTS